MKRLWLFISIAALLLAGSGLFISKVMADSDAGFSDKQLGELLVHLNDDRSVVRERAFRELLRMHRSDLPTLKRVIMKQMPLAPGQIEVVRGIVEQVYTVETPYDRKDAGFLGVVFDPDQEFPALESIGVEIRHRIPGFSASRYLEDGDVVLSINGPDGSRDVHVEQEVREVISRCRANDDVTFKILRRGRITMVPILLDGFPGDVRDQSQLPDFINQRQTEAEGYWKNTFAPLFDPDTGAHAASQ